MKRYLIVIGPRECPRLSFEVMATDSLSAMTQHLDLVHFGERLQVRPL